MTDARRQAASDLKAALEAVTADVRPAPGSVMISNQQVFQDLSGGLVRSGHAVDAVRSPDDLVAFSYQETGMFVATKAIHTPNGDFVLLAVGFDDKGKRQVASAYRLYDDPALAKNARQAFQVFLERFALPYEADGRNVLFVPVFIAEPDQDGNVSILDLGDLDNDKDWVINAWMQQQADGTVKVMWPFAVDTTAYKAEVRRHQS